MVLHSKRSTVDPLLSYLANRFNRFSANTLSWIAFLFAVLAGMFFYFSSPINEKQYYFLLLGSLCIFLNGLFDAIDGKVAKLTNTTSKQGDFLDHALDRFADVFIVGGISLSGWCDIRLGFLLWLVCFSLVTWEHNLKL